MNHPLLQRTETAPESLNYKCAKHTRTSCTFFSLIPYPYPCHNFSPILWNNLFIWGLTCRARCGRRFCPFDWLKCSSSTVKFVTMIPPLNKKDKHFTVTENIDLKRTQLTCRRRIWLLPRHLLPSVIISLVRASSVPPVELILTGEWGKGWARSQIIPSRESLAFNKSFNTLGTVRSKNFLPLGSGFGK